MSSILRRAYWQATAFALALGLCGVPAGAQWATGLTAVQLLHCIALRGTLCALDVQVRGPYARWEHRHRFLEDDGGTVVEDRVVYKLPMGPLGRAAHAALVGRQLRTTWDYRARQLATLLGPVRPGG